MLANSLLLDDEPHFENTVKVVPPNRALPRGQIVVSLGSQVKILRRALFDEHGNIDMASASIQEAFPIDSTMGIGTDNQTVRLKDGSILIFRTGHIWSPINPPPAWFGETITSFASGEHKGQRGCEFFFRSTDGGDTWQLHSTLDFAYILGGKYGYPRPLSDKGEILDSPDGQGKYPDGSLKWYNGDGDRQEIYVCPFTGFVYLTTRVFSGPYKDFAPLRDNYILFYSTDNAKTWKLIKEGFPTNEPLIMTSTPDGRLFLFQDVGSTPTVYFSKAPVTAASLPEISPGYPVFYVENGKNVPLGGDINNVIPLAIDTPAISRVSIDKMSSKIRVAYQSVNEHGRQEACIIRVEVREPNQAPSVFPVRTVRPKNATDHSVMHFAFVDPDYIDMPVGIVSNTSILYWIESPKQGMTNGAASARYMMFEGDFNTSCPGDLSTKNGVPTFWTGMVHPGHYLNGGFFWKDNTLNYLAQWSEGDGLKANIVTVPYQPPTGNPRMTCAAVWQQSNEDEIQVYGASYDEYRKRYDVLWPQGWRLHLLENHVVANQVLYTAVWHRSTSAESQVYGWKYEDFRKKYDQLWPNGWRLSILNNYVLNGQVLYTAVWRRPAPIGEIQVYEWSYENFRREYDVLWCDGWRLKILNVW